MNAFAPVARHRVKSQPGLMLGAPFRAGAAHVVQFGPVAIADVHNQVVDDAGEVGDGLSRLAGKIGNCGPVREIWCDRTGIDDALADHLFSPSGWMWVR